MKAISPVFARLFRTARPVLACALLAAATSCAPPRVVPTPAPTQAPPPRPLPAPVPAPADWRDAPITPGNWTWAVEGGQSVARFGQNRLILRCDRAAATVTIEQTSAATTSVPMTIQTDAARRVVTATPAVSGGLAVVTAGFAARDSILDALAFSRGRFAVLTAQEPALYAPSWPEISRVIEDCR